MVKEMWLPLGLRKFDQKTKKNVFRLCQWGKYMPMKFELVASR